MCVCVYFIHNFEAHEIWRQKSFHTHTKQIFALNLDISKRQKKNTICLNWYRECEIKFRKKDTNTIQTTNNCVCLFLFVVKVLCQLWEMFLYVQHGQRSNYHWNLCTLQICVCLHFHFLLYSLVHWLLSAKWRNSLPPSIQKMSFEWIYVCFIQSHTFSLLDVPVRSI